MVVAASTRYWARFGASSILGLHPAPEVSEVPSPLVDALGRLCQFAFPHSPQSSLVYARFFCDLYSSLRTATLVALTEEPRLISSLFSRTATVIIKGGHPNLGCCVLPSKFVSDPLSLVRLTQLFKAKYSNLH